MKPVTHLLQYRYKPYFFRLNLKGLEALSPHREIEPDPADICVQFANVVDAGIGVRGARGRGLGEVGTVLARCPAAAQVYQKGNSRHNAVMGILLGIYYV